MRALWRVALRALVSRGDDPYEWIVEGDAQLLATEHRAEAEQKRADTAECRLASVLERARAAGLDLRAD